MIKTLLLLTLFFLHLLGDSIKFTEKEREFIQNNRVKIAITKNFYPFSYKEFGEIKGFAYDYMQLLLSKSDLKYEIVFDYWNDNLNSFSKGEIDIINAISYTPKRAKFTEFTKPFFEVPNVIFVQKGDFLDYEGLESLKGKKVGITKGIFYKPKLEKLHFFELVEFSNSRRKMEALAFGHVDAVFNSLISGQKYIQDGGFSNIKILDEIAPDLIQKEDLRVGIRKDKKTLVSIINKSFDLISKEERENLILKWFGTSSNYKKERKHLKFSKEEIKYLKNRGSISMCIDPDWMPFDSIKNGEQMGINKSFITIFETLLEKEISLVQTQSWQETLDFAKEKKCDIVSLIAKNREREEYLGFTDSYLEVPMVVATRDDSDTILNIKYLDGVKIAVVRGNIIADVIKKEYPKIEIVFVDNLDEALKELDSNRVFGVADSLMTLGYKIKKAHYSNVKINGTFNDKISLRVGVRDDDKVLLSIFKKAVKEITPEQKDTILNSWFSIKYEKGFDYQLFFQIILLVFVVTIFFAYRQYILKKSNEELKSRVKEELKKSRDKDKIIFHQNKLAAMGEMIENIAHQWRQPLSQINSAILIIDDELYEKGIKDKTIENELKEIEQLTKYLSSTIDDFKRFFEKDKKSTICNIEQTIQRSITIVRASLDYYNIEVIESYGSEAFIKTFANELQQSILVILNNAKDALVSRGVKNPKIEVTFYEKRDQYIIEIQDNAGGIKESIIERIFEPYFSTKHPKQGTGLGLYISKMLIEESLKGELKVKNSTFGACFSIVLKKELNG